MLTQTFVPSPRNSGPALRALFGSECLHVRAERGGTSFLSRMLCQMEEIS